MLFIDVDVCRIQIHLWSSQTVTMVIIRQFSTYLVLNILSTCLRYIVSLLHKIEAVMEPRHFFMMNSLYVAGLNHFYDTDALDLA